MRKLLTALLLPISVAGHAVAQNATLGAKTASEPTEVDAKATGPQDSIGTSGTSPTKSLMQRRNEDSSGSSGTTSNNSGNIAPGSFRAGHATDVHKNPDGRSDSGTVIMPSEQKQ